MNRERFAPNEWYHCYNRGIDKRRVFESKQDYQRFVQTLYLCNSTQPLHRDNFRNFSHNEIFVIPRQEPLVSIAAYCLMPNHFHLLLKEKTEGGITRFMRKVGTAYTMYFNIKNERVGNLFNKPFRTRHVVRDQHFQYLPHYIHLNPAELFEPGWKFGRVKNFEEMRKRLCTYQHSSLPEYIGTQRIEGSIIDREAHVLFQEIMPPLKKLVINAISYYQESGITR